MEEPTSCDNCPNNFLSHKIEWCPECDLFLCESCWNDSTRHHCFEDQEDEREDDSWYNEWESHEFGAKG